MFWKRKPQLDTAEQPRRALACWVYGYGPYLYPRLIFMARDGGVASATEVIDITVTRRDAVDALPQHSLLPLGLFSDFAAFLQEAERAYRRFPAANEIAERAAAVRQEWNDHDFTKRSGHDPTWTPPLVSVSSPQE